MTTTRASLIAGATIIVVVALLVLTHGNAVAALAFPLTMAVVIALLEAPLRISATVFLFVCLLLEDVRSRPHMDIWRSPLHPLGRILYDGLEKSLGVPGLKVFGIEVALVALFIVLIGARLAGRKRPTPPAMPMLKAALIGIAAMIWLEVWGTVRGGNVRFSMLQMRPLLFTFLVLILFSFAYQRRRDARAVITVIVAVGVLRAFLGFYFWRVILVRTPLSDLEMGGGTYITTHADTVLWVTGLLACIIALFNSPRSFPVIILNLTVSPILGLAIVANNRRVAFVSIAFGLLATYLLAKRPYRARINRLLMFTLPVLLLYVAVAWHGRGLWAQPVTVIRSVLTGGDTSADMRDIENYNLVVTAKHHPLAGWGFGHPYVEEVRGISITNFLEAYLFLPHNSLLWLMGAAGLIGFALYWAYFFVGVFVALRVYQATSDPTEEVVALVTVTAVITFVVQCYADVGIQSWMGSLVLCSLLGAMAGRAGILRACEPPPLPVTNNR